MYAELWTPIFITGRRLDSQMDNMYCGEDPMYTSENKKTHNFCRGFCTDLEKYMGFINSFAVHRSCLGNNHPVLKLFLNELQFTANGRILQITRQRVD
ncbi:hypothetical protein L5515_009959 [Caenorhabditis briggsae]|uniref:Uncharacterized protein n=1 Tax=Caenorhabditis briggsae TaxID=6238 RepID=A0AAE9FBQ4_CAEBR|nr:hypothetical protein L5515_009959 [Caenorhabditis briggsae]